jgi:putative addiction module component (TIGR02574 family)
MRGTCEAFSLEMPNLSLSEVAMTGTIEQLKSQASILSAPDRAELAYFLLSSLEPEEEGVQEAWRTEIAHRAAEIRSGAAVGRTADEVLAELKEGIPAARVD